MNRKKYGFVFCLLVVIAMISLGTVSIYVNHEEKKEATEQLRVVTSFYPMYVAAMNVTDSCESVTLENLSEPQTGCLHDYQLTPEDMKLLSTADMFVINGGGIESFMSDVAKAYPDLTVTEACRDMQLIAEADEDIDVHGDGTDTNDHSHEEEHDIDSEGTHDHDGEDPDDPDGAGHDHGDENAHAWMSVSRYRTMVSTIADALSEADPSNASIYNSNAKEYDQKLAELEQEESQIKEKTNGKDIIIFHEAYEYVADDFGMNVRYLMDLDEERSVSAGEVSDVIAAVKNDGVSVILAEELYGKDLGDTVSRETDVKMVYIDPLNRGDYDKDSYIDGMKKNFKLIEGAF